MVRIILLLLLTTSCSRGPEDKGIEILPDMVHSVAVEAFSESKIHPLTPSMKLPPKGSIPRGKMPFDYDKGTSEAIRAGEELVNPIPTDNVVYMNRGKEVYQNYCLVCHGVSGDGDGPLIPKFPNPPSFMTKRLKSYKDGHIFHIITLGSGDMPEHATQITIEDRWKLVNYVKKLQGRIQ